MGQIVSSTAKSKRCNLNKLSQLGTPAAGEHILVSSDNSMNAAGQGNFDCYIVGDGATAATALPLKEIVENTIYKQVEVSTTKTNFINGTSGKWQEWFGGYWGVIQSLEEGKKYKISTGNNILTIAILESNTTTPNTFPDYSSTHPDYIVLEKNSEYIFSADNESKYLFMYVNANSVSKVFTLSEAVSLKEVLMDVADNYVSTEAQSFTDLQMKQARANLGLGDGTIDDVPSEISHQYGWISRVNGIYTQNTAPTTYLRKFALDSTKKYTANIRMIPADIPACGIAYFDVNNNFICGQYNKNNHDSVAKVYTDVPLNIPPNASYCLILGNDSDYLPKLFLKNSIIQDINKEQNLHEHFITSFAILGQGNTNYTSMYIPVESNSLYRLDASPNTWSMPEPTADTTAIGVWQYDMIGDTYTEYKVIAQSEFNGIENGLYFETSPTAVAIRVLARALPNVPIKLTLTKVDYSSNEYKGIPPTNEIIYQVSKIKGEVYKSSNSDNILPITRIDSAWGCMFPSSYKPTGKPTQVIAMLHGSVGYVTPSCLGYDSSQWIAWRNAYLNAGFAVMDINGWGISTSSDAKSAHWGCPLAIETIDKAFDELKEKYNVCAKLMIHGTSMGGAAAWTYAFTHPNKINALALMSPATVSYFMFKDRSPAGTYEKAIASWQYASVQAAIDDNFQRVVGYDPYLRMTKFISGIQTQETDLVNLDVLDYGSTPNLNVVGQALPFPVRIWHGSADAVVPFALSTILVNAFRNGGNNVTLRTCPNEPHNICTGTLQYMVDESIDFFNCYKE